MQTTDVEKLSRLPDGIMGPGDDGGLSKQVEAVRCRDSVGRRGRGWTDRLAKVVKDEERTPTGQVLFL